MYKNRFVVILACGYESTETESTQNQSTSDSGIVDGGFHYKCSYSTFSLNILCLFFL
jgi:hypothetical protein